MTHTTWSLSTKVPLAENEAKEVVANRGHRDNVTVSHSVSSDVSVVSVKYSFDESRGGGASSEEAIGITSTSKNSSDLKVEKQNQNGDHHQNVDEVSNTKEHLGEFEAASKVSTPASDSGLTNDR